MTSGRRRPVLRLLLGILVALVLLVVLGVGAAALLVDPNSFRPQIEAQVRQVTGRGFALRGPLTLQYGLRPTFAAQDIELANMPGGSRPQMVTARRLAATVALLPLLSGRLQIVRCELDKPDILLETDAAGRANWQFAPVPGRAPQPTSTAQGASGGATRGLRLGIGTLGISDGALTWHDGRTGRSEVVHIDNLTVAEAPDGAATTLGGALQWKGHPITLAGQTGPIGRLFDAAADTPWPVKLNVQSGGDKLAVDATVTHPLEGKGYALRAEGAVTDLSPFAALLPAPPPAAREVSFSGQVSDSGGQVPTISAVTMHVTDLTLPQLKGLALATADVSAPSAAQPVRANLHGTYSGQPVHAGLEVGSLAALLPGAAPAPLPVSVSVDAAGAQASLRGTIARPQQQAGLDLSFNARIPDLAALRPLAQANLPAWKDVALGGTVTGDLHRGGTVTLHKVAFSMPQVQTTGDFTAVLATTPEVQGTLTADRLDLDGLIATAPQSPAKGAAAAAATSPPAAKGRLIPDTPFDLAPLHAANADLRLSVAALHTGGQTYRDVSGHLVLRGGKLTVDPFTGSVPGGRLDGRLALDANGADPPAALRLHAPALALQPLAVAFHAPDAIAGTAFVDIDLTGHGNNPQALAASANGRVGVAMQGGTINPNMLGGALHEVLNAAKLPTQGLNGGKPLGVRCLALRLDARNGVGTVTTLLLDAGDVQVQGAGTIALGPETLALQLRPLVKIGPGIIVPVRVDGSLLHPRAAVDAGGTGKAAARGVLGGVLTGATGGAAAALLGTGNSREACGPALAAARGEAPAPAPPPATSSGKPAAPAPRQAPPTAKPLDALRGLIGK
jgi:AsmA protein